MSIIQAPDAPAAAAADPAAPAVVATDAPAVAAADPVDGLFSAESPVAAITPPSAPVAAPAERPAGVPEALWDATTGLKTDEAVARLVELEGADAARKADVPADAASYKLEPAEPIIDPTTKQPITFNGEDPLAKGTLAWAHENGVPQAAVSALLSVFAKNEMATLAAHNEAVAAETAKLGTAGEARLVAVSASLAKHAGPDGAKAIMSSLASADAVVALEKVIKALAGPTVGTPPAAAKTIQHGDLHGVELLSASLT